MTLRKAWKAYYEFTSTVLEILVIFVIVAPFAMVAQAQYERIVAEREAKSHVYKGDADDWCKEYCGSGTIHLNTVK